MPRSFLYYYEIQILLLHPDMLQAWLDHDLLKTLTFTEHTLPVDLFDHRNLADSALRHIPLLAGFGGKSLLAEHSAIAPQEMHHLILDRRSGQLVSSNTFKLHS